MTLSLDSKVYDTFQKYCEENAIMLSKKLELVMKEIMKNKKVYVFHWDVFAFGERGDDSF